MVKCFDDTHWKLLMSFCVVKTDKLFIIGGLDSVNLTPVLTTEVTDICFCHQCHHNHNYCHQFQYKQDSLSLSNNLIKHKLLKVNIYALIMNALIHSNL